MRDRYCQVEKLVKSCSTKLAHPMWFLKHTCTLALTEVLRSCKFIIGLRDRKCHLGPYDPTRIDFVLVGGPRQNFAGPWQWRIRARLPSLAHGHHQQRSQLPPTSSLFLSTLEFNFSLNYTLFYLVNTWKWHVSTTMSSQYWCSAHVPI